MRSASGKRRRSPRRLPRELDALSSSQLDVGPEDSSHVPDREASVAAHRAEGRRRDHRAAAAGCDDPGRNGAGADRRGAAARDWASSTSRTARCRTSGQPKQAGRDFDFPFILKPLEPLRDYVTVVSGLRNKGGESASPHGIIEETWLNCVSPRQRNAKTGVGVTRGPDRRAAHGQGHAAAVAGAVRRAGRHDLVPHARAAAADGEQSAQGVLRACSARATRRRSARPILNTTGSLLDYVRDATASLNTQARRRPTARSVSDYLDSVREIERRVQKLEENARLPIDLPDAPLGPPEDFGELLDMQFEMMALAWQTNRTRVATFRMVEEASMRTYPEPGRPRGVPPALALGRVPGPHRQPAEDPELPHRACSRSSSSGCTSMREGDGTVLDNSLILFGSNMANSDAHNNDPLPQALIGRGGGVKGNQHLHFPQDTPHANILVTMLQRAGVPAQDYEKFADSTGAFSEVVKR